MEFQKIINLLIKNYKIGITSNDKDLSRFATKKLMINQKKVTTLTKKLELKHQCLDQVYVILVMRILL